tara:strand:+ start:1510 stop:1737 length:228 start_codon:yes stop_codon:yes gene_type:complete
MSEIPQYFAQIDADNIVTDVAVVQRDYLDANPDRYTGTWVETFVNLPNKTYAGIGFIYDPATKDFHAPPYIPLEL